MNTKPSQHLIDAAWGLYCEQTAGSMDVRDSWHELSPKVQILFLMKVVDSGLSEHSVEYSEPELTTEHARVLQDIPKPDDPVEGADNWEALLSEYRPSMSADVLHAWARDAVDAIRRLAAKPQAKEAIPNDDDGIEAVKRHGIFFYEVDFGDEGKGRYIRLRDFNRIVEKLESKPQDDQDRKDAESIGGGPHYGECSLCDGKGYVPTLAGGSRYCEACRATVENSARIRQEGPAVLTDEEKSVIENLLALTYATWNAADNSEDMGDSHNVDHHDYQMICDALDALDELPDDQPGYTMGPAAKARWALRRHIPIDAAMAQEAGNGP